MLEWYQNLPQYIHPIAFAIGSFALYWYAICFLGAALVAGSIFWLQAKKIMTTDQCFDFIVYVMIGILIGGRVGYVVFYNLLFYIHHPLAIISPVDIQTGAWIGIAGMSYFGGLIGFIIATWLFTHHNGFDIWRIADMAALSIPMGYFFGRIGNFLNGELYGRMTDKAWGMYFSDVSGLVVLRHPSQLYEAFFEGLILIAILLFVKRYISFSGGIALIYVMTYSTFRFFLEFFREPDPQIGFLFGWITLGQIFSAAFILIGLIIFLWLRSWKCDILKHV